MIENKEHIDRSILALQEIQRDPYNVHFVTYNVKEKKSCMNALDSQ